MAQHFLLSPACRDLPIAVALSLSESEAYEMFKQARWPTTHGEPVCPHCGADRCYRLANRRFKCSLCRKTFSVTSGTILAHHKLSFRQMFAAMVFSVNAVKGKAALQLSRELGVSYKTAFVLLMKLREAICDQRRSVTLDGVIEIDGMVLGGHVKPKNRREVRVDRRKTQNQSGKRLCLMALRQRQGRIVTAITRAETSQAAWSLVRAVVRRPATLLADENPAYDDLAFLLPLKRVNHSTAYVAENGSNINQVEAFFSRVRRSEIGVHHHMCGRYADWYAADLAWREDVRGESNGWQTEAVLKSALAHPTSRVLCGYWQGDKPPMLIFVPEQPSSPGKAASRSPGRPASAPPGHPAT